MGQKAKNAGMKKRSPKKEPIDRLSKQHTNVIIHNVNYNIIRELANIINFGNQRTKLKSKDKQIMLLTEMTK